MQAVEAFNKANELAHGLPHTPASVGYGLALQGEKVEASEIIEKLKKSEIDSHLTEIAIIYVALDERESAFDSIEQAYCENDVMRMFLNRTPMLDPIRLDPRYGAVRRKLGIA